MRILAAFVAIALLAIGIAAFVSEPVDARRGPDIEVVREKARGLNEDRLPVLHPSTSEAWAGLDPIHAYEESDTGDEYLVDTERNLIVRYARARGYEQFGRGGAYLPQGELLAIAEGFAERFYEAGTLRGMRRSIEQRVLQEGPVEASVFAVEYRLWEREIETFNHVLVHLDASTGELLSLEQDFAAIEVGLSPGVSLHEARAIAAGASEVPESCIRQSRLMLVRDAVQGRQHLVWLVTSRTGDEEWGAEQTVLIDAHSGAVLLGGMGEH